MRNPTITIIFTNVVPLISKPMEHLEVLLKSPSLPLSRWVDYSKIKFIIAKIRILFQYTIESSILKYKIGNRLTLWVK